MQERILRSIPGLLVFELPGAFLGIVAGGKPISSERLIYELNCIVPIKQFEIFSASSGNYLDIFIINRYSQIYDLGFLKYYCKYLINTVPDAANKSAICDEISYTLPKNPQVFSLKKDPRCHDMAERHRATAARPLNIEVENVFGMNFFDLL